MNVHASALGTVALLACCCLPAPAFAQGGDVTVFGGYAYPRYSQTFRAGLTPVPILPGVQLTPDRDFTLDATGGGVFGVAVAFEVAGVLGIEGRLDSTRIKLESSGVHYTLDGGGLGGSIAIGAGSLPIDRLNLLSLNLRLRTPGAVTFYVSGGFSYLPDFSVGGSLPLTVEVAGLPIAEIPVSFVVAPSDSSRRYGVNAGAGLRFPVAPRVSLVVDGRVFYFKEYELAADLPAVPGFEDLSPIGLVQFDPIFGNLVGGIAFRF
jgi:opacity protein-like surface antigen